MAPIRILFIAALSAVAVHASPALACSSCGLSLRSPEVLGHDYWQRHRASSQLSRVSSSQSFNIELLPTPALQANPEVLAAFERAASVWEAVFTDPITIRIEAGYAPISGNTIARARGGTVLVPWDELRPQLLIDASDELDDTIVDYFPVVRPGFSTNTPLMLQPNVAVQRANLKALGFPDPNPAQNDGLVEFNSNFEFDFDNSDGVDEDKIDFQTIAIHELAHVLGFTSAVDLVDTFGPLGAISVAPTMMDLYRFKDGVDAPSTPAEFATFNRSLEPGTPAVSGFVDASYAMSQGLNSFFPEPDGRQASHFKANEFTGQTIGIMDPSFAFGEMVDLSFADIQVLDLIGWDVDRLAGDANGDGTVDLDDFDRFTTHFGMATDALFGQGDFNRDGSIDLDDFFILQGNFGVSGGGVALARLNEWYTSQIPEPATALLIGCSGLFLRRRLR